MEKIIKFLLIKPQRHKKKKHRKEIYMFSHDKMKPEITVDTVASIYLVIYKTNTLLQPQNFEM